MVLDLKSGFYYIQWKKKRNWLCEYDIMKHCFRKLCPKYELNRSNFITAACTYKIYIQKNRIMNSKDYKCNLFYSILRDKKFDTLLHQSFLARNFKLQRKSSWCAIYIQQIKNIYDRKVAEFNFKLMHNFTMQQILT